MPTTIPGTFILQSPTANDPLLDMNTQPSLDLQFATSKTLDDRVSGLPLVDHQRDVSSGKSAGTYVGSDGLVKTSAANLLTYSEEFDNAAWTKQNLTAVLSDNLAPDGTLSAYTLTATASNAAIKIVPSDNTNQRCLSVFISKTQTCRYAVLYGFRSNSFSSVCVVDLQEGIITDSRHNSGVYGSINADSTISSYGNYYRVSITIPSGVGVVNSTDYGVGLSSVSTITPSRTTDPVNQLGDVTGDALTVWGAQLETGTTATDYIPTTNLPSAAPRFDHDPDTGESLGLLVEEARTNSLLYSQDFTTNWTLFDTGDTLTSSAITAPDGTLTGTFFAPDNTNSFHIVRQTKTYQGGITYTLSVFAKEGGRRYIQIAAAGSSMGLPSYDYRRGVFDLQAGSVYSAPTNGSADVQTFANGWYKCSMTFTPASPALARIELVHADASDPTINIFADGNGTDGVYIWGAQIEEGSFPTSYIPTSGSTVTRSADVASITGTNFSRWYNQSEGTVYFDFDSYGRPYDVSAQVLSIRNSTPTEYIEVYTGNSGTNAITLDVAAGRQFAFYTRNTVDNGKYALALQQDNFAVSKNGLTPLIDTNGSMTSLVDRVYIGGTSTNTQLNGTFSRLTYYPYRLGDTTLQDITS